MRSIDPPSINQMVGRQVRRWMLDEERKRRVGERAPCVALSRLPGSGAAEVGGRVADALGFGFFGLELVDRIAREASVQRHLVAGLDERMRDAIHRFVRDGVARRHPFGESEYHEALMRVLGTFAKRGLAVILGRGSAFALPEERTLRVLLVASRPYRIARLQTATGCDPAAAAQRIELEEQQRIQFNRHHFDVDPDDPALYDLVVNTETLGIDGATRMICEAVTERFGDRRWSPHSIEVPVHRVPSRPA